MSVEHLAVSQGELRDLVARHVRGATGVIVGLALRRQDHAAIAHEDEPEAQLIEATLVVDGEEAEHADELLGFLDRLADDRGDEVLARLDAAGGQVEGAVALLDDEITRGLFVNGTTARTKMSVSMPRIVSAECMLAVDATSLKIHARVA